MRGSPYAGTAVMLDFDVLEVCSACEHRIEFYVYARCCRRHATESAMPAMCTA
jgi:hypothetical protein